MNLSAKLTPRETEVAEIMAFTKSKSDAADRLCISEGTLSAHTFRIYDKLEINSKSELVIWWMVVVMHIEKQEIPYFKLIPVLLLSFGLMSEKTMISRQPTRRPNVKTEYVTSK